MLRQYSPQQTTMLTFSIQQLILDVTTQVAMFNVGDLGGTNNAVVLSNAYTASVAEFSLGGWKFQLLT